MRQTGAKVFSLLDFIMNIVCLNLLFLLFSLPVLTVGASMTALFSGWRAAIKHQPCYRAFFASFKSSFCRATLAWIVLLPLNALMLFSTASMVFYQAEYPVAGFLPRLVISTLFCLVLLSATTMVFLFYSRFEGSFAQLLRYGGTLSLTHPLRAAVVAVLMWLPVALAVFAPSVFLLLGILWLFFYFSVAAIAAIWLMNRPFANFARTVLGMDVPHNHNNKEDVAQ